jgi:uncharacterized membrane protein
MCVYFLWNNKEYAMTYSPELWFLWFMLYSFVGWLYESILCSVAGRKLVNRGFLSGPVCPIYGTGAVAAIAVFGSPAVEALAPWW